MEDVMIRFWSALIGITISIWSFYKGGAMVFIWWYGVHEIIVIEFLSALGLNSITMVSHSLISNLLYIGLVSEGLKFAYKYWIVLLFIPLVISVFDSKRDFKAIAIATFGHIWITYPCSIGYRYSADPHFIMGLLNVIWFTDAGAYFCGKFFGQTPLLISVSPKKSVEGTLGGLIVAQIVGQIVAVYVTTIPQKDWIWITLIASVTGQIGDLFESLFKRSIGIKDSGILIPGHGGLLDRFDAVLFAFIFVDAYLTFVGIRS